MDLNRAPFEGGSARDSATIWRDRIFVEPFDLLRADVLAGRKVIATAFKSEDEDVLRLTQLLRCLSDRIEHGRISEGEREMTLSTSLIAV